MCWSAGRNASAMPPSENFFAKNSIVVRAASIESINYEQFTDTSGSGESGLNVNGFENSAALELKPVPFRNRFLNFVWIGTIFNNALESFFKSEIRTRLFVTGVLLFVSRLGYGMHQPRRHRHAVGGALHARILPTVAYEPPVDGWRGISTRAAHSLTTIPLSLTLSSNPSDNLDRTSSAKISPLSASLTTQMNFSSLLSRPYASS